MAKYTQLNRLDRRKIYLLKEQGLSKKEIAERIGCHRSTIYRELKRNKDSITEYYWPDTAEQLAHTRHHGRQRKIVSDTPLYHYILRHLKQGWSPEQIAGRLKCQQKPYSVCHETIYQFVYERSNKDWFYYLPRKKPQRGKRYGRKTGSGKYLNIRLIHERPEEVHSRNTFGHWEADTIGFATNAYLNISTLVERKSRYIKLIKNRSRKSKEVMPAIRKLINSSAHKAWKTITFDQGSEFANHQAIELKSKCKTYYCEPHSPWQRGSNENMNGRLRRYLPRDINIANIQQHELEQIEKKINNLPRKCLQFKTPREVFSQHWKAVCRSYF
jgi:transposase, IS30 family